MLMIQPDPIIVETVDRLLGEQCSAEVINAAEDGHWPASLWQSLEDAGATQAWVAEAAGGGGASIADGFAITRLAGKHAVPVPLAETLLAGHLLAAAGLEVPTGPLTIAPVVGETEFWLSAQGSFEGSARRVPCVRNTGFMVATIAGDARVGLGLFDRSSWRIGEGDGIVKGLDANVHLHGEAIAIADTGDWRGPLLLLGAAVRSHQIAGALEHMLAQSIEYAQMRNQFGRPISKFQAVQHNLAVLAGEAAAAGAAADGAMKAIVLHGLDDTRTFMAVASAKIRAGEAAGTGAAIAHQVHGAIGFTREYSLHQRTRRLWTWRDDFHPERVWADRLGRAVCAEGADRLWPSLTAL